MLLSRSLARARCKLCLLHPCDCFIFLFFSAGLGKEAWLSTTWVSSHEWAHDFLIFTHCLELETLFSQDDFHTVRLEELTQFRLRLGQEGTLSQDDRHSCAAVDLRQIGKSGTFWFFH